MITIREGESKKVPNLLSLSVSFKYNADMVIAVKQCDGAVFDKKTSQWEVPISELALLLDNLTAYDDIELYLLPDWYVDLYNL